MFRLITIEREFGSGAASIAAQLAQRLGWKLWDHLLTEEIAHLAKVDPSAVKRCDERMDSRLHRLAKVFWRGSYERSLPVSGLETFDCDRMTALMQHVVESAASEGNCVIVGRGCPYFLRGRQDTLAVFLFASREDRLKRVLQIAKNEKEANELVDSVDQDRVAFVKHYFEKDWPYRPLYKAMLNTGLGDEITIDAIVNLMNSLNAQG